MKKLRKIKLSNIENSQLEKDQLISLKGGCAYGNPCYVGCQGCMGAGNAVNSSISTYQDPSQWVWH